MDNELAQLLAEADARTDIYLQDLSTGFDPDDLDMSLDASSFDIMPFDQAFLDDHYFNTDLDLDPPKLEYKLVIPPLRFKKKPKPAKPKPDILFVER